jgi:chorismate dehydratase
MENKIKVSVVSYLNSKPFAYGLLKSEILKSIDLSLDIPSKCAAKLESNQADIGLVPVAALVENENLWVVSDKCIGSEGKVRTVVLASEVPVEEIETILMDYQSRSSVLLTKVLANFFWKKEFIWKNTLPGFENKLINGKIAGVVIGDRVFDIEKKYKYIYDLSEEWQKYTGLPFVFAVWATNKSLTQNFQEDFDKALTYGLMNIQEVIKEELYSYPDVDLSEYFTKNIKFFLDDKKREAMALFIQLAHKLEPVKLI